MVLFKPFENVYKTFLVLFFFLKLVNLFSQINCLVNCKVGMTDYSFQFATKIVNFALAFHILSNELHNSLFFDFQFFLKFI